MTQKENERPISSLTGPELLDFLNILSQRQAEYSKIKIQLTEDLIPIDQARAKKRAEIAQVTERQRQCRTEISACKYALKGAAEGLT